MAKKKKPKLVEFSLDNQSSFGNDIIESISDGFFFLDNNLIVKYFNKAAEKLLGRKRKDVLEKQLFKAFPEAKGSLFEKNYRKAIKTKKALSFEIFFGKKPYINWYNVKVYPNKKGISVLFQVTTKQKKTEEELRKNEKQLRSITENIQEAIFAKDINRKYTFVNNAAAKMMHHPIKQIIGKTAEQIFSKKDAAQIKEIDNLNFKEKNVDEIRTLIIKGNRKILHTVQSPIFDKKRKVIGITGIVNNVTEEKEKEEKLKEKQEQLEKFVRLTTGREERIIELKEKIK